MAIATFVIGFLLGFTIDVILAKYLYPSKEGTSIKPRELNILGKKLKGEKKKPLVNDDRKARQKELERQ